MCRKEFGLFLIKPVKFIYVNFSWKSRQTWNIIEVERDPNNEFTLFMHLLITIARTNWAEAVARLCSLQNKN